MRDTLSSTTVPSRLVTISMHDMDRPARRRLASALALCALCAFHAPSAQAAGRLPAPPSLADFQKLSGARGIACAAPHEPALAGMGAPSVRRCAWSRHIEMLYWKALPDADNSCLPLPALAWHRLGAAARASVPPWSGSWSGQSFQLPGAGLQQAGALWRRADGHWSAVLWRWSPSIRPATRAWQAGRWDQVLAAARGLQAANPAPARAPLTLAWLDASKGKPRLTDADGARWISGGACLDLRAAGTGQSQLHLPYSRDDARQEQRSAMQVQLARRYPHAEWLKPFTLIEPATPGARSGAKFVAVWKEGASLQGQLWITLREDGGIVRARIASDVQPGGAGKERAALVERELAALARAWEARHE